MTMRTIDYYIDLERQQRNVDRTIRHEAFIEEFYAKNPELKRMDTEIVSQRTNKLTAILDGDFEAQKSAELIKQRVEQSKKEYLLKHNIPSNYEDELPICDKCNDTGYVGENQQRKVCRCMQDAKEQAFNAAGLGNFTRINAKNYEEDYCKNKVRRKEVTTKLTKIYQKKESSRNNIWIYTDKIQSGKTYVSVVLIKQIIGRGDTASYIKFEDIGDLSESNRELVNEADVLFIDDFSAALTTSGNNGSILNNILETRSGKELPTIFITNESVAELLAESDVRIAGKIKYAEKI